MLTVSQKNLTTLYCYNFDMRALILIILLAEILLKKVRIQKCFISHLT